MSYLFTLIALGTSLSLSAGIMDTLKYYIGLGVSDTSRVNSNMWTFNDNDPYSGSSYDNLVTDFQKVNLKVFDENNLYPGSSYEDMVAYYQETKQNRLSMRAFLGHQEPEEDAIQIEVRNSDNEVVYSGKRTSLNHGFDPLSEEDARALVKQLSLEAGKYRVIEINESSNLLWRWLGKNPSLRDFNVNKNEDNLPRRGMSASDYFNHVETVIYDKNGKKIQQKVEEGSFYGFIDKLAADLNEVPGVNDNEEYTVEKIYSHKSASGKVIASLEVMQKGSLEDEESHDEEFKSWFLDNMLPKE